MVEYLYQVENTDPKFYLAKIGCPNCEDIHVIKVEKGKYVGQWIKEQKLKCQLCQCIDTVQTWRHFLAERSMLSQMMEVAKKEEDVEGKKFGYYK